MKTEFIDELSKILEVEPARVTPEFVLEDGNWDSVSMISVIGFFESRGQTGIDVQAMWKCTTVKDLLKLLPANFATPVA